MILSNINNSVESLKDLANKTKSLSLIAFVEICKSSIENSSRINAFNDTFVFILFICNFLPSNNIMGSLVDIFTVKLYGSNKNLTSFKSRLISLLISKILFVIFLLNFSLFNPTKLK